MIISSFNAPVQITAWVGSPYRFTGASTFFCCIILFILASDCKEEKIEKLVSALLFTGAIVAILALLQYLGVNLVPHEPSRQRLVSYATMPHPNFLGTYMAFLLPAAILRFISFRKSYHFILTVLIFIGLLVSLCRGAWLATVAGIIIIIFYAWKEPAKRRNLICLLLVFVLITGVLMPLRGGFLINRIFSISGQISSGLSMEQEAGTYRLYIWEGVLKLLPHYWAFGVGPDHLIYAMLKTPIKEIADKAHNIFLEIAVTMGVFALAS
ncbi:MAG: O-antigen ligase family protein, partial [Eubacteriales bacterium]